MIEACLGSGTEASIGARRGVDICPLCRKRVKLVTPYVRGKSGVRPAVLRFHWRKKR